MSQSVDSGRSVGSQGRESVSVGGRVAVPAPEAVSSIAVQSSPGGVLELGFDPSTATASRPEGSNDLVFETDNGGRVLIRGFFEVGDESLPTLRLPDGVEVAAADFFSGSDMDMTTAAGPSRAAAGSGTSYDDDAGNLLDSLDKYGKLGTDYWGGGDEDDLAPEGVVTAAAEAAEIPGGDFSFSIVTPTGPDGPGGSGNTDEPDNSNVPDIPGGSAGGGAGNGLYEDWQPYQHVGGDSNIEYPGKIEFTFNPTGSTVVDSVDLTGFTPGAVLYLGDPSDPNTRTILISSAAQPVSLSAAELTAGVYVRPPDNDDTDMDIAAQAHLRATSSGITTVAAGAFIIIVDAVADLPVVTGIDPEGDSGFTGNEQEYVTVQVKATTFNDTDGSENHYIIIENIPAEWKIGESNTSLPDGWRVITNGDGNDPYPPIIGQEDNLERVVILVPSGTETVQGSIIFDPHEWTNAHNDGSPLELTIKAASWEHNLAGKELDINNNYSEVTITENYIVSIGDLKPTLSDIELDESYIKGGTLANSQPEVGALGRSASINIPDGYTVDVKGEEWTQDADAGNWALSVLDGKGELSWNGKELTFTLLKNSEHPDANEDNELLADALTLQIPLTHTATGISGINAELKIQIHDDNLAVEDSIGTLVWHKDLDTPEGYFTHKNEISLTGQSDASKEGEPKDLTFSLLDDIVSITSAKIEFTEAGTISSYTPEGVVRQHSSGIYADLPKGKEIRDDADEMDFFNDLGYAEGLVVNLTGLAFGMTLNLEKFFNMNGASGNNGEVETGMVYFYKVSNVDDEEIAELVGTMPLKSVDASGQSQLNFETVENAFNRVVITPTKPDKEDSEFCIKSVKFTTLDDFVRYDEGMAQGSTSVAGADGIKEGTFTFNISQLSQNLQTVDDDKITVTFTDTTHCVGYLGDAKAFDVVLNQYTGEWVYLQSKVFTLSEPLKLSFTVTDNDGDISTAYIQVNYDDSATSDTTDTGTFEGNTVLSSLIGDVLSDDMSQEITSILNNSNRIVSVEKEGKLSAVFSSADGDNDTLSGGTGSDIFIFESLTGGSKDTITDFEYGKDQLHFTDLLTSDDNTVASLLDNLSAETWNDEKNTLSLNLENEGTLTAEFLEGKLLLTIASSNNNGTTHEIDITFDSGSSSGTPSCTVPEDVTQAAEILKNMLENYQG